MSTAPHRQSWVASANDHADFGLHNLPLGIFSTPERQPRGGVAIGDEILDLTTALQAGLFEGAAEQAAKVASAAQLNDFFALGSAARQALRHELQDLLDIENPRRGELLAMGEALLIRQAKCTMHMPARVGDYTDFYVGIHHAMHVGQLFRPDQPLLPNYKYVPIGYHGRASTLGVSPTSVKRPLGQTLRPGQSTPDFGPTQRLDFELEMGIWIGPGNRQGESIKIATAAEHIAGFCLLNDWSARDIQTWEYQPLGPFLSKSFATSISPWVITAEALAPFRCAQPARPVGDPKPLDYLYDHADQANGALDIQLEALLLTERMRSNGDAPCRLSLSNTQYMYWTAAQLVAHHSVNGCSLQPGDLFGTGTLSGPAADQLGSLLEMTGGGKQLLQLPNGETRTFLMDGDEIILRARCERDGVPSIGFGECRGVVLPNND